MEGKKFSNYVQWLVMTFAISLVDVPALSLPCGYSNKGLPIGLQMIARRGQDAQILAAAAFYEKTHGFSNDVPLRM